MRTTTMKNTPSHTSARRSLGACLLGAVLLVGAAAPARADENVTCTLKKSIKVRVGTAFVTLDAGTKVEVKVRRADWSSIVVPQGAASTATKTLEASCAGLPPRPEEPAEEAPKPVKPVKVAKPVPPPKPPKVAVAKPPKPAKPAKGAKTPEVPVVVAEATPPATPAEPVPAVVPEVVVAPTSTPLPTPAPTPPVVVVAPAPAPPVTPPTPEPPVVVAAAPAPAPVVTTPTPPPPTGPYVGPMDAPPIPLWGTVAAGGVAGVSLLVAGGAVVINQLARSEAIALAKASTFDKPVDGALLVERQDTVSSSFTVAVAAGITGVVIGAATGAMAAFTNWSGADADDDVTAP